MRPRLLLTITCKFAVDFFARGLHTRTAVARLPLRQLGFLVAFGSVICADVKHKMCRCINHIARIEGPFAIIKNAKKSYGLKDEAPKVPRTKQVKRI